MQVDNRFCRNCGHHRDGHITICHLHLICNRVVGRACYGSGYPYTNMDSCSCPEYVPKDNLEYLEYMSHKKEAINETPK
jgi:hypothetical protein